jgi:hypothetical protein
MFLFHSPALVRISEGVVAGSRDRRPGLCKKGETRLSVPGLAAGGHAMGVEHRRDGNSRRRNWRTVLDVARWGWYDAGAARSSPRGENRRGAGDGRASGVDVDDGRPGRGRRGRGGHGRRRGRRGRRGRCGRGGCRVVVGTAGVAGAVGVVGTVGKPGGGGRGDGGPDPVSREADKEPERPGVPAEEGNTGRDSSLVRKSSSLGGGEGRRREKGKMVPSKMTWREIMTRFVVRSRQR